MADTNEKGELGRLEDFIALSRQGKDVQLSVTLRKQIVTQKAHSGMKGEEDIYLLIGDYSCTVGSDVKNVAKIYVSGTVGEPRNAAKQNIYIANARLSMDYIRLREADIIFEEKYWEERA